MSCCERSRILHVSTGRTYDVEALPGLLHASGHDALKARLQELVPERAVIVSDTNVAPLYARAAADALGTKCAGIHVIPAGEASKTPAELVRALEAFAAIGLTRSSAVIALGGGVIGALAGLAAALWMRGIDGVRYIYFDDNDNRYIRESNDTTVLSDPTFTVVQKCGCPAVLVEEGFITNAGDVALVATDAACEAAAQAYYECILTYFDLT